MLARQKSKNAFRKLLTSLPDSKGFKAIFKSSRTLVSLAILRLELIEKEPKTVSSRRLRVRQIKSCSNNSATTWSNPTQSWTTSLELCRPPDLRLRTSELKQDCRTKCSTTWTMTSTVRNKTWCAWKAKWRIWSRQAACADSGPSYSLSSCFFWYSYLEASERRLTSSVNITQYYSLFQ